MSMGKDLNTSTTRRIEHFGSVRHMVKNHMSVIIAFSQLLEQDLHKQSIDQSVMLSHVAKISTRAKKMVEEIDQVLSEETASLLEE